MLHLCCLDSLHLPRPAPARIDLPGNNLHLVGQVGQAAREEQVLPNLPADPPIHANPYVRPHAREIPRAPAQHFADIEYGVRGGREGRGAIRDCGPQGGQRNNFGRGHQENYEEFRAPDQRPKRPKIDFSKFDGGDRHEWLDKAERYFTVYEVDRDERTIITSFYLEGRASKW